MSSEHQIRKKIEFLAICRLMLNRNAWKFYLFGTIFGTYFVCHVAYLSLFRFDYGYNMQANVFIGNTLRETVIRK